MASVRSSKITKYLKRFGHDVHVLTATNQLLPSTLDVEISKDKITYSDWYNINKPFEIIAGGKRKVALQRSYLSERQRKSAIIKSIKNVYKTLFYFPDDKIGWIYKALKEVESLFKEWEPDIMYVSSGPFSGFILGNIIHKKYKIPWIAEYRDLWTEGHYYNYCKLRKYIERKLEKYSVGTSSEIITVSEPLANKLSKIFSKNITVINNGFDSEDQKFNRKPIFNREKFHIVYTGSVYVDYYDLEPLINAIIKNKYINDNVKVHFFGPGIKRKIEYKYDLRSNNNIENIFLYYGCVSHTQALNAQSSADLLLFLGWGDKNYLGILTGKLFEYLNAQKKILSINIFKDSASSLILKNNLGYFCKNSEEVELLLMELIKNKKRGKVGLNSNINLFRYDYKIISREIEKTLIRVLNINNK